MNLDPVILRKLVNRRLFTAKDLLLATHLELVEGLDISSEAVGDLLLIVSNATAPRVSTVSAYGQVPTTANELWPVALASLFWSALCSAGQRSLYKSPAAEYTLANTSASP